MNFFFENFEYCLNGYSTIFDREYFITKFKNDSFNLIRNFTMANFYLNYSPEEGHSIFSVGNYFGNKTEKKFNDVFIFINNDTREKAIYIGYLRDLTPTRYINWILSKSKDRKDILAITPLNSFYEFNFKSEMKMCLNSTIYKDSQSSNNDFVTNAVNMKLKECVKLNSSCKNFNFFKEVSTFMESSCSKTASLFEFYCHSISKSSKNHENVFMAHDNCEIIFLEKLQKIKNKEKIDSEIRKRYAINYNGQQKQSEIKTLITTSEKYISNIIDITDCEYYLEPENEKIKIQKNSNDLNYERNMNHIDVKLEGLEDYVKEKKKVIENEFESTYIMKNDSNIRPLSPTSKNVLFVLRELPPLTSSELLSIFGIPTKSQSSKQKQLYGLLIPLIKLHAKLFKTLHGRRVFKEKISKYDLDYTKNH